MKNNLISKETNKDEPNTDRINRRTNSNLHWVNNLAKSKRRNIRRSQLEIPKEEQFSFDGMISKAKIHSFANRPLMKLKEFDGSTKFCQCCYLPVMDNISLKSYSICENTDKFVYYGAGTSLYFSYYRFSIFILAFVLCLLAFPSFYFTNYYTNQLIDICEKIYDIEGPTIYDSLPDCINFINIEGLSKFFIKKANWEFKYDGINLKHYRKVYKTIMGNDDEVDKVIINYHITSFITLITLLIINTLYIIMLFNKNNQYNLLDTTPSDFTIIITNLYSAFQIFWENISKINTTIKAMVENKKRNRLNTNESSISLEECRKEIELLKLKGFSQDKEINILEGFNHFLRNNICVNSEGEKFNIYRINICYKLSESMQLEEKIQEEKKKIFKINYQKHQIDRIQQLILEEKERKYFYNP